MSERRYDGRHVAGDVGKIDDRDFEVLGPCPGCGARFVKKGPHPDGRTVLLHPMPFCNYYGATSPEKIEKDTRDEEETS